MAGSKLRFKPKNGGAEIRCIIQPEYVGARRKAYEIDLGRFEGLAAGLGKDEPAVFHWCHYCRFKAIQAYQRGTGSVAWRGRDKAVTDLIVVANLGWACKLAWRADRRNRDDHAELEDCRQDAAMVLHRIIGTFDVSLGWRFSTYAARCIQQQLRRNKAAADRRQSMEAPWSWHDWDDVHSGDHPPRPNDPETPRIDLAALIEPRMVWARERACLSPTEQTVIERRFGLNGGQGHTETLWQIGERLGVSKERVRQIQIEAIAKLRLVFAPIKAT